ncbi:MAG: hypothetical protein K6E54_01080 [Bacteroidaceae bacterium]|nr:hypothetical protein [Bacteroidaceae bacterium]
MIKKSFLLLIVIVLTFSCSDKEDSKIIAINPGLIELSDDLQESYFQLAEGDYPMYGFSINYDLDGKNEVSYNIAREILASEQTVIELSDRNKATFYCQDGKLQKLEFDFMTICKVEKGKYKVQLHKNGNHKLPYIIDFGFNVPDGISTVAVLIK